MAVMRPTPCSRNYAMATRLALSLVWLATRSCSVAASANKAIRISTGRTIAAHIAVLRNDAAIVEFLLEQGADANSGGSCNATPLELAKTAQIAELLIKGGAEVNQVSGSWASTPLSSTANIEVAKVLIVRGAKMSGRSALMAALHCNLRPNAAEPMWHVYSSNTAPDVNGSRRTSPEINTAIRGRTEFWDILETVRLLLDSGADVNLGFPDAAAIRAAVQRGKADVVQLLLQRGAHVPMMPVGQTTLCYTRSWLDHIQSVELDSSVARCRRSRGCKAVRRRAGAPITGDARELSWLDWRCTWQSTAGYLPADSVADRARRLTSQQTHQRRAICADALRASRVRSRVLYRATKHGATGCEVQGRRQSSHSRSERRTSGDQNPASRMRRITLKLRPICPC